MLFTLFQSASARAAAGDAPRIGRPTFVAMPAIVTVKEKLLHDRAEPLQGQMIPVLTQNASATAAVGDAPRIGRPASVAMPEIVTVRNL